MVGFSFLFLIAGVALDLLRGRLFRALGLERAIRAIDGVSLRRKTKEQ